MFVIWFHQINKDFPHHRDYRLSVLQILLWYFGTFFSRGLRCGTETISGVFRFLGWFESLRQSKNLFHQFPIPQFQSSIDREEFSALRTFTHFTNTLWRWWKINFSYILISCGKSSCFMQTIPETKKKKDMYSFTLDKSSCEKGFSARERARGKRRHNKLYT